MKKTLCDLLIQRYTEKPEAGAIGWIEKDNIKLLSFKAYKESIEAISIALLNLGLDLQDKVSLLSNTRYEWNLIDLGIMCAGGITVPIYPSYTNEEVSFIIDHSDSNLIFLENEEQLKKIIEAQESLGNLKKIIAIDEISAQTVKDLRSDIKFFRYSDLVEQGHQNRLESPDLFQNNIQNIDVNHVATIVYTSGTTGQPKGAVIKHSALFQVLKNVDKYALGAINSSDRILTYLPLSHVLGRFESFTTIALGNETIYAESMAKLIENITLVKPTILVAVPRVLEKIYERALKIISQNQIKKHTFDWAMKVANLFYETLDADRIPSSGLIMQYALAKKLVFSKIYQMFGGKIRYFISGGAPLDIAVIHFLRNAGLTVLEGYGLTETIAPCTINPLSKQVPGSVGQPIGDVEIKFSDENEILIKSKALFSGYFKDEEETMRVLDQDGWFYTGDIGRFDAQGFLKITDRKKDIIITSGGKNISPQKIENILKRSPYIEQCLVIGDKRKFLTALIGISKPAFQAHFEEFEISEDCDFVDLASHPKINELVQVEIKKLNKQVGSFETIKNFRIVPIEISQDNYLTPSLKLKKKALEVDYKNLIDAMYQSV